MLLFLYYLLSEVLGAFVVMKVWNCHIDSAFNLDSMDLVPAFFLLLLVRHVFTGKILQYSGRAKNLTFLMLGVAPHTVALQECLLYIFRISVVFGLAYLAHIYPFTL